MPSGDKAKFSKLDELAECEEEEEGGVASREGDAARAEDASKAQDMVDQLCDKITQNTKVEKSESSNRIPWKVKKNLRSENLYFRKVRQLN